MSHAKETLTRNTALQPEPVKPEITLGDEEVSDVSLATFHVVDKENAAGADASLHHLGLLLPGVCSRFAAENLRPCSEIFPISKDASWRLVRSSTARRRCECFQGRRCHS